ncbi:carbamoyltransferase [Nocardia sp. alder85J]|uniref:carbamoyltransferase family protein n=1 Tax=Nocardia sp. alder85J TaxID=2862949 RepID=UPI001CD7B809|nr:carbamoyltransferase C-terminal domain-containing protein [Nocardia sp. alder85J]MCX4094563.1 hypothetical protein [Nocardia sp. alder85J]
MGYILGLGGPYFHDAAACLITDTGEVIAFAEEERFTRVKHNMHSRSATHAAAWCCHRAGIHLREVDEIAVAWNPAWPLPLDHIDDRELISELLDPRFFGGHTPARVTVLEHHLAHAAAAFYPSGYTDAAVMVVDGSGDGISTSIHHGTSAGLRRIRDWPFTQSLGWFYETVAEHIGLGDWTSAGKLMGLAAYGTPVYSLPFLQVTDDGYRLDLTRYGLHPGDATTGYTDLSYYRDLKRAYQAALSDIVAPRHRRLYRYNPTGRYDPDTRVLPHHADLAASAQQLLQDCLLAVARTALRETGTDKLCLAGGVGLNCTANGVLHDKSGTRALFVQPAAGDAGCALGTALECARRQGTLSFPLAPQQHTAFGPEFDDAAIRATLDIHGIAYTEHGDAIADLAADALADGAVIGWFQGPTEAGPRALGNRSILGDPRDPTTRDRINCEIKRREPWRPLAPSLLDPARWSETPTRPADFMIVAHPASDAAIKQIPATVHVDGTIRPQLVHPHQQPRYARLLNRFQEHTGIGAVLNTSFNADAEPIVCTPADALRTFYATPLDALAIGGFMITKPRYRAARHTR